MRRGRPEIVTNLQPHVTPPKSTINIYPQFTHYLAMDVVRCVDFGLALVAIVFVVMIARVRWRETRHSASLFLAGVLVMLVYCGWSDIINLGHPYIPVYPFRALFLIIVLAACVLTPREYARPGGLWDPPAK